MGQWPIFNGFIDKTANMTDLAVLLTFWQNRVITGLKSASLSNVLHCFVINWGQIPLNVAQPRPKHGQFSHVSQC